MNYSEIENHTIEHFTTVCERRYKNKGYSNFSDYVNNHSREEIENLVIDFKIKETIKLIPDSIVVHWSINSVGENPGDYLISDVIENLDFEDTCK